MSPDNTAQSAFETAIEPHQLGSGLVAVSSSGFDPDRAAFPAEARTLIRSPQLMERARLEVIPP